MQRPLDIIIISKKEPFVKNVLEFCEENGINAKSYSYIPAFSDPLPLVLLDIDSMGEGSLTRIKNKVICLTSHFESKDHLKKLLKAGAITVKPFRLKTVTSSIGMYYKGA